MAQHEQIPMEHIEYLVHQSTQGLHFLFEKEDIVKALKLAEKENFNFFTQENREKVQNLLLDMLQKTDTVAKRSYLESLTEEDRGLLIQAYFHLVDNTILSQRDLKH